MLPSIIDNQSDALICPSNRSNTLRRRRKQHYSNSLNSRIAGCWSTVPRQREYENPFYGRFIVICLLLQPSFLWIQLSSSSLSSSFSSCESPAPQRAHFSRTDDLLDSHWTDVAAARNACLIRIVSDAQTTAAINRFHEQVDAFTSTRHPPPFASSFALFLCHIKPVAALNRQ